jgi:hypothetical protein
MVWNGPLSDLGADIRMRHPGTPGVIVIGEVASLSLVGRTPEHVRTEDQVLAEA